MDPVGITGFVKFLNQQQHNTIQLNGRWMKLALSCSQMDSVVEKAGIDMFGKVALKDDNYPSWV